MKWQFLVLSLVLVAACAKPAPPAPDIGVQINQVPNIPTTGAKTIKIGFIGPLTGNEANLGVPIRNGAQLAVDEIDDAGGVAGSRLELVSEDGLCDAKAATQAGNKLILTDKVIVIVGGVCSAETLAVAPIAESNKVVLFSPSSSNPDITKAGDFVFRSAASDTGQGEAAAQHMKGQGIAKAAALYANSDYNLGLKSAFQKSFEALGGAVVAAETYERTDKDFRTQITKIKDADPEAVFIVPYSEGGLVIKQLTELGLDAQLYGSETLNSKTVLDEAGEAAEGLIYTTPKWDPANAASKEFTQRYLLKFGVSPEFASFAANAYDNVKLIAKALEGGAKTAAEIKAWLYTVKGYPGAGGTLTIDSNGDAVKEFEVMTVKGGEFVKWEALNTSVGTQDSSWTFAEIERGCAPEDTCGDITWYRCGSTPEFLREYYVNPKTKAVLSECIADYSQPLTPEKREELDKYCPPQAWTCPNPHTKASDPAVE